MMCYSDYIHQIPMLTSRPTQDAEEITELLNRDIEPEDRPFQTKEVAERLRNAGDAVLTLYWSKTRPRR